MTLSGNVGQPQGTEAKPPVNTGATQEQNPQTVAGPTEDYKRLQRDLQREKDRAKQLETRLIQYQGDLSAEERLTEAQTRITELERENQLSKVLRDAEPEVRELIEKFTEKFGMVPDDEYVALLTQKVNRTAAQPGATQQQQAPTQENSGLRNAPPQQAATKDEEVDAFLKTVKLDNL